MGRGANAPTLVQSRRAGHQLLEDKAALLAPGSQAAKSLRAIAAYYRHNQPYMDYAEYLRRGWPIGTWCH